MEENKLGYSDCCRWSLGCAVLPTSTHTGAPREWLTSLFKRMCIARSLWFTLLLNRSAVNPCPTFSTNPLQWLFLPTVERNRAQRFCHVPLGMSKKNHVSNSSRNTLDCVFNMLGTWRCWLCFKVFYLKPDWSNFHFYFLYSHCCYKNGDGGGNDNTYTSATMWQVFLLAVC